MCMCIHERGKSGPKNTHIYMYYIRKRLYSEDKWTDMFITTFGFFVRSEIGMRIRMMSAFQEFINFFSSVVGIFSGCECFAINIRNEEMLPKTNASFWVLC